MENSIPCSARAEGGTGYRGSERFMKDVWGPRGAGESGNKMQPLEGKPPFKREKTGRWWPMEKHKLLQQRLPQGREAWSCKWGLADQPQRGPERQFPQLSKAAPGDTFLPALPSGMCHGAISVSL